MMTVMSCDWQSSVAAPYCKQATLQHDINRHKVIPINTVEPLVRLHFLHQKRGPSRGSASHLGNKYIHLCLDSQC